MSKEEEILLKIFKCKTVFFIVVVKSLTRPDQKSFFAFDM